MPGSAGCPSKHGGRTPFLSAEVLFGEAKALDGAARKNVPPPIPELLFGVSRPEMESVPCRGRARWLVSGQGEERGSPALHSFIPRPYLSFSDSENDFRV